MTGTSWKRKVTTAIVTAAMAASMLPMSAFAEGALTLDGSITVGGLEKDDTASFYRIVEQDLDTWDETNDPNHEGTPTHVGTQGWKLTSLVDKPDANGVQDGIVDGTEDMEFGRVDDQNNKIKGLRIEDLVITKNPDDPEHPLTDNDKKVITARMANAIASAIAKYNPAATHTDTADDNGFVTVPNENDTKKPASGLYMVVATPGAGNVDTIYKPIFVSADYNAPDGTNSLTVVPDPAAEGQTATDYMPETDAQGNPVKAMFKRSDLNVDKKSGEYKADGTSEDTQHDVAVGDIVDFTITTNVPTYSTNYDAPVYKLTDVITKGLVLCDADGNTDKDKVAAAIKVAIADEGYSASDLVLGKDYTIDVAPTQQFVVSFLNDNPDTPNVPKDGFLYRPMGSPKVTITYKAKVTADAVDINQMDNTVKLNFSNDLTDTKGKGELQDKTRHYTFNIDANIFGRDEIDGEVPNPGENDKTNTTSEIRKTVVEASKSLEHEVVPTKTDQLPKEPTDFKWLQDAKFELTQTHEYTTADPTRDGAPEADFTALTNPEVVKFNNKQIKDANGKNFVTSDEYGYIAMKGLDAGKYVLREIDAPLGYSFDPSISYQITITPTYKMENPSSTDPDDKNEILEKYTVEIVKCKDGQPVDPPQKSISTYTAATNSNGDPVSFLNETFKDGDGGVVDSTSGTPNKGQGVTITLDSTSTTTLIENKKLGILPATGGSGIIFYLVVGGAIAGTAALLIEKDRKKRSMA